MNTGNILCFFNNTKVVGIVGYNTKFANLVALLPYLCGGDVLCPFKVNNVAVLPKVVKLSFPVTANNKGVNVVLNDVPCFLTKVLLNNNLVNKPCFLNIFNSCKK